MKVVPLNKTQNFKGILNIEGPNSQSTYSLTTENISYVAPTTYIGRNFAQTKGSYICMTNGSKISTYTPRDIVLDAYKKAVKDGEATLKTPFDPLLENKGFLG